MEPTLEEAFKEILVECVERAGSIEQLPPFLHAMARALNITQEARHIAGGSTGGAVRGTPDDVMVLPTTLSQQQPEEHATGGVGAYVGGKASAVGARASGGANAFSFLRRERGGSSTHSGVSNQPGRGKGKGGAGGTNTCVPCTMIRHQLTSASAARHHPNAVRMDAQHQKPPLQGGCPICKCSDCKKVWGRDNVQSLDFTKAVKCVHNKFFSPAA
jgi:hypothetical protein